eukprot:353457-Chlamydomonas_euryale.AAC.6
MALSRTRPRPRFCKASLSFATFRGVIGTGHSWHANEILAHAPKARHRHPLQRADVQPSHFTGDQT